MEVRILKTPRGVSAMRCVVFMLAWVVLVGPALGRDVVVSNTQGDDRNSGHHWQPSPDQTGPVRSLAKALRLANTGDRIVLANTGQPYRESISLVGTRHSGLQVAPFVIVGNGATLDGSAPVPPEAWKHFDGAVFRFRPRSGGAQQLFLLDKPVPFVPCAADAARPPKLDPLQWSLLRGEIYFCVEKDKLPRDYSLSFAYLETGITLYHVERVAILDLVVQGFRVDGINASSASRGVEIIGVTIRGNGRSGVAVGGAAQVDIQECTIGNNGRAQLLTLPNSETHVRSSDLLPLTAPAWVDEGGRFFLEDKRLEGGLEKIERPQTAQTEEKEGKEKDARAKQ
jgi:hypothetical protein